MKRKGAKILVAAMLLTGASVIGITSSRAATAISAIQSMSDATKLKTRATKCWAAAVCTDSNVEYICCKGCVVRKGIPQRLPSICTYDDSALTYQYISYQSTNDTFFAR